MFKFSLIVLIVTFASTQNAQKDAYEQQLMGIISKFETSLREQQIIANRSINFAKSTNFPDNVKLQMLN